ncbi:hypothetical protein BUE93_09570 [Chromobacterium amazonense]|uniref:Uncharacterized protein n=1 Tax=Chromobacterium amazonense TaxID=1382803 RepID=A0A2S9X594_9NEIS|nr:hypothetical protein BUE93_09570 [Chromobacterium amazonense]
MQQFVSFAIKITSVCSQRIGGIWFYIYLNDHISVLALNYSIFATSDQTFCSFPRKTNIN